MRVDTGTYTGDANADQTISGLTNCTDDLGSTIPSLLIAMPIDTGFASSGPYWTTNNFDSGYSKSLAGQGQQVNTHITGLGTGSFTVSGNFNTNGVEYSYLALQYDGVTLDIETGNYDGTGSGSSSLLTYDTWTPDAIIVGSTVGFEYTAGRVSSDANTQFFGIAQASDAITAVNEGNCTLGTNNNVNQSGNTYQWVAIGEVAGFVDFLEYAGNSTIADRNITGVGFKPDFAWILHSNADDVYGKEVSTDDVDISTKFANGFPAAGHIQDLISDGVQVSQDNDVNGTGNDYFLWSFKQYAGESGASAILTGTAITGGVTESEIVLGGDTIISTLTGDTYVATAGDDNAITDAIIAGITSAQSEANGWNNVVKANMVYTDITRTSDTILTIILAAEATYSITANETITMTIPATALTAASEIVSTPNIIVTNEGAVGNPWYYYAQQAA